jgi:APA family basic amino acid/polyamine antiporter
VRFLVWMVIGLVVYAGYGYRHSRLGRRQTEPSSVVEVRRRPGV